MEKHELGNEGGLVKTYGERDGLIASIKDEYGESAVLDSDEARELYEVLDDHFSQDDGSEANEGQPLEDKIVPDNPDVVDISDGEFGDWTGAYMREHGSGVLIREDCNDETNVSFLTDNEVYNFIDEYMSNDENVGETECLCGHDPHWEDHEPCPFSLDFPEDDGGEMGEELAASSQVENDGVINETTCSEEKGCEIDGGSVETNMCVCGQEHEDPVNPRSSSSASQDDERRVGTSEDSRHPSPEESTTDVEETVSEWSNVYLGTEVDIEGASTEQKTMYAQMASIYEESFETFVKKNRDYGSSFLEGGVRDAEREGGPFDDPQMANLHKLWTRTGDKRDRFHEQVFGGGEDFVGEDVGETAGDSGNYWFMVKWLLQHGGSE